MKTPNRQIVKLPKLLGGLMFMLWAIVGGILFSISSEYNPNYGTVNGQIIPVLAYMCILLAVVSLLAVLYQFFKER